MATTAQTLTKPKADTTYEWLSVVERLSFWTLFFTLGYLASQVAMNSLVSLFGDFLRIV